MVRGPQMKSETQRISTVEAGELLLVRKLAEFIREAPSLLLTQANMG